jgi:hypothetical protein
MEEASAVTYSIGASIAVFFRCHPHGACAARSITALSSEQTERSSSDRSLVHISLPLGRAQPPGSAASAPSSPPVAPVGTRAEAAQQARGGVNLGLRVARSLGGIQLSYLLACLSAQNQCCSSSSCSTLCSRSGLLPATSSHAAGCSTTPGDCDWDDESRRPSGPRGFGRGGETGKPASC